MNAGPIGDPRPALLDLPIQLIDPPWEITMACEALGLRLVGDLLRLPRTGVAARFGDDFLHQIDCLVGTREDPARRIVLPPRFAGGARPARSDRRGLEAALRREAPLRPRRG